MRLTKESCLDFLLSPFSSEPVDKRLSIDFKNATHQELLKELDHFLRYHIQILPGIARASVTHGQREQGVDLVCSIDEAGIKVGWQVKSASDLRRRNVINDVVAQATMAKNHDLNGIVFVLAGTNVDEKHKIPAIISQLSQSGISDVHILLPRDFSLIFDSRNWEKMRARGVSRLLETVEVREPEQSSLLPDPGPLNPVVEHKQLASFKNPEARSEYDLGLAEVTSGRIEAARQHFELAHKKEPNADTFNALGNLALLAGDLKQALRDYQEARARAPSNLTPGRNAAIVLRRLGLLDESLIMITPWLDDPSIMIPYSKTLSLKGQREEAYRLLKDNESLIKPRGRDLLEFASRAYDVGNYDVALKYYSQFSLDCPKDERGPWGESLCHAKLTNLDAALAAIERAFRISPERWEVRSIRAGILRDLHHQDQALIDFEIASVRNPSSVQVVGNFANLLREVGRPLEAVEYYDRLLKYYPYDPLLWENRGKALSALGLHDQAFVSLSTAVRISKDPRAELLNDAGLEAHKAGRLEDAISLLKLSIEKKETLWQPKSNLASIMLELGFCENAAKLLLAAIEVGDNSSKAHTMLASCLIDVKRYGEATAEAEKALSIDPDFPSAIGTLGLIAEETGRLQDAKVFYDKALKLDGTLAFVHAGLARLSSAKRNDRGVSA